MRLGLESACYWLADYYSLATVVLVAVVVVMGRLRQPTRTPTVEWTSNWPALACQAFVAGGALALAWLGIGLWQTTVLRRRSRPAPRWSRDVLAHIVGDGRAAPGRAGPARLRLAGPARRGRPATEGYGPAFIDSSVGDGIKRTRPVKNDVPIRGRLTDLQGRPVVASAGRAMRSPAHRSRHAASIATRTPRRERRPPRSVLRRNVVDQYPCRAINSRIFRCARSSCSSAHFSAHPALGEIRRICSPVFNRPRITRIRSVGESARNLATSSRITSVSLGNLTGRSIVVSFCRGRLTRIGADRATQGRCNISDVWIDSCMRNVKVGRTPDGGPSSSGFPRQSREPRHGLDTNVPSAI